MPHSVTLDLDKTCYGAEIAVRVGETRSAQVEAEILDGGSPASLTGKDVSFEMWVPGWGHASTPCETEGSTVSFEVPSAPIAFGEPQAAYVAVEDGASRATTGDMRIRVIGRCG